MLCTRGQTWFFLDMISILPFDVLVVLGIFSSDSALDPSLLRMVRMIRLTRLFKLARIVRASRIFQRWENGPAPYPRCVPSPKPLPWPVLHLCHVPLLADAVISLQYSKRYLIKWMIAVAVALHWFSCCLAMLAQLHGSSRTPELEDRMVEVRFASSCCGLSKVNAEACLSRVIAAALHR